MSTGTTSARVNDDLLTQCVDSYTQKGYGWSRPSLSEAAGRVPPCSWRFGSGRVQRPASTWPAKPI